VFVAVDDEDDGLRVQLLQLRDEAVARHVGDGDEAGRGLAQQLQGELLVALEPGVKDARPEAEVAWGC
jgi:hypothetical protein